LDSDITIREAKITDYECVNALFTEELAFHIEIEPELFKMPECVMTMDWFRDLLRKVNTIMYIAEVDGKAAGLIQVMVGDSPNDPIFRKRRYTHIEDIVVAQEYQHRGVGRELMQAAHMWAKAQGALAVELWVWQTNERAIQFYKHLGYTTKRLSMEISVSSYLE
jgi:GNAT superfamily N-acetyltransferase